MEFKKPNFPENFTPNLFKKHPNVDLRKKIDKRKDIWIENLKWPIVLRKEGAYVLGESQAFLIHDIQFGDACSTRIFFYTLYINYQVRNVAIETENLKFRVSKTFWYLSTFYLYLMNLYQMPTAFSLIRDPQEREEWISHFIKQRIAGFF